MPTLWSAVFKAGHIGSAGGREALETLCRTYWQPVYAFLRRWGFERQKAKDLTQGFFAYLLENDLIREACPEKGRFRSFLLATLRNFVGNEQRHEQALKRGGGAIIVSLDEEAAEGRYAEVAAEEATPEKLFDRRWAMEVLVKAMGRLAKEYERAGRSQEFALLQPCLTGDHDARFHELAAALKKTEGAVRAAAFRLRREFRDAVRGVVAETVADPEQVEGELNHLKLALRGE